MIIDLIIINVIVALIFNSGFWDNLDGYINERFKFHHLPHLFMCALCQCWWLSLLYVIVTGNLSLLSIMLCIVSASLTDFTLAVFGMLQNVLFKIVEIVNKLLDYIK